MNRRLSPTPELISVSFSHPLAEQQTESSLPLKDEARIKDDVAIGTLLDINSDETNQSQPPPTILTNAENDLFNLNFGNQTDFSSRPNNAANLLDISFDSMSLDKPILHRNASETILPAPLPATITVPKTETKSSSNQNIDHADLFEDLLSSTSITKKTSSNESLAAKQAAGKHI